MVHEGIFFGQMINVILAIIGLKPAFLHEQIKFGQADGTGICLF